MAVPAMKVKLPANTVGVKEKVLRVEMPAIPGDAFLENASPFGNPSICQFDLS